MILCWFGPPQQRTNYIMYLKSSSKVFDPKCWQNTTVKSQPLWMIIFCTFFLDIVKWADHCNKLSEIYYLLMVLRLMFMKCIFPHTTWLCLLEYNLQLFCFFLNCKIKWRRKLDWNSLDLEVYVNCVISCAGPLRQGMYNSFIQE